MKRLAIVVHPGWNLELGQPWDIFQGYMEMIKEYDKAIIFINAIYPVIKKSIICNSKKKLVEYLVNDERYMENTFGLDSKVLSVFKRMINNDIKEDIKDQKHHRLVVENSLEFMVNDTELIEKSQNIFNGIFDGDITWIPEGRKLIDLFKEENRKNSDIEVISFGGVNIIISSLELILKEFKDNYNIDLNKYDVDIFGENYNECVLGVTKELENLGYKVNRVKSKSVFRSKPSERLPITDYYKYADVVYHKND